MHKLFLLLLIVTIASCRNDESEQLPTTANVTVMDLETSDSLPFATVIIFKVNKDNTSIVTPVHEATSDSLGYYSYTFMADERYYYYATATSGSYLIKNYNLISRGAQNNIQVKLAKPGYLSIHLKNTSPVDANDEINIFDSNYYLLYQIFEGMAIDTTIVITAYGNQSNPVNWKVTKNDTTITYNQSFNYISLDTISFDLFY
jgi:hypothetical protein